MKFKLLSKNIQAFGLDVSGDTFKFMQLEDKGTGLTLKAYDDVPLSKAIIANDTIIDNKTFEFLLKQHLDKPSFGRLTTNYVVASLPESKSFVRVIQIPKMNDSEADNAVPYEAESFIPLPLDQVYLDWQKLGDVGDPSRLGGRAEGDKMNILMVASPKEFVDKYLMVLDKVGLKPAALEVESQSCLRAVLPSQTTETVLLLDMDASRSSLIMVEDGGLQFTSTIPIAGDSFTESIARSLGVSSAKAEQIKRQVGLANTAEYPNIKTALLPILNNFEAEIRNILKFHSEHSNKTVEKVLLMGGSAKLKNLADFLGPHLAELGVNKVEQANPLQNLKLLQPSLDVGQSLGYVTAIGLAMRGVNFAIS